MLALIKGTLNRRDNCEKQFKKQYNYATINLHSGSGGVDWGVGNHI